LATRDLAVGHAGRALLPTIDVRIERRQFWAVIGPNGSGKTTFVRTLLGLAPPVRGTVTRAADLRPCYVPQQAALDSIFPIRVLEFVRMGLLERGRLGGPPRREAIAAAHAALDSVSIGGLDGRLLRDLSGGQRQRVLLARALAARANLYVLDEPTAALDGAAEHEVLELVSALVTRTGASVVMITHVVEDGLRRADRVLLLDRDHQVAEVGTPAEIAHAPALQRLYGPVVAPHPAAVPPAGRTP
jgi:zinc transport system ATP-binding protein